MTTTTETLFDQVVKAPPGEPVFLGRSGAGGRVGIYAVQLEAGVIEVFVGKQARNVVARIEWSDVLTVVKFDTCDMHTTSTSNAMNTALKVAGRYGAAVHSHKKVMHYGYKPFRRYLTVRLPGPPWSPWKQEDPPAIESDL